MTTRTIDYRVSCGDIKLNYKHDVLVEMLSTSAPRTLMTDTLQAMIFAHHKDILSSRTWTCGNCSKPAVDLVHTPMSYLHMPEEPLVLDMVYPICENGSECDRAARREVDSITSEMFDGKADEAEEHKGRFCLVCGKVEDKEKGIVMKKCGRCRVAEYCGAQCQNMDWTIGKHKMMCSPAK